MAKKIEPKAVLNRVVDRMSEIESVDEAYEAAVSICQKEFQAEASALFLENESGDLLSVVAAHGYGRNLLRGTVQYSKGEGLTGTVWETGETIVCNNRRELRKHAKLAAKYDKQQWTDAKQCHNLVIAALSRGPHVFGVLKVENKRRGSRYAPFSTAEIALLEEIAAALSLGVQYAMLAERRITRSNQNEFVTSVLQYPTEEVEVFLNVDRRHFDGPIIVRDGRSAPRMQVADWYRRHPSAWRTVPGAVKQRYRTLARFLQHLDSLGGFTTDPEEWPRGLSVKEHERDLQARWPGLRILAMQGAGDLTMNLNNIAILDGEFVAPPEERDRAAKWQEEHSNRLPTYSCLVKTHRGMSRLSIRDVVVDFGRNHATCLNSGGSPSGLTFDDIEFALYGQQLIKSGRVVPLDDIVDEFTDRRHIFSLVELEGKFFGRDEQEKYYFGEAELVDHPQMCRDALTSPVEFDTQYRPEGEEHPLGADVAQIIDRLLLAGYEEVVEQPARLGEFVRPGPGRTKFRIFLKEAYYPLTMVGLDAKRETLFLMAISGQSGRFALTVGNAARLFRDRFRVTDALLIDEGADVFQQVGSQQPVQMHRRQVRAVLAVGLRTRSQRS